MTVTGTDFLRQGDNSTVYSLGLVVYSTAKHRLR